jgi:WD40 repeat protein
MYRLPAFLFCLLLPQLAPAQTQPDCDKMLRDGDAFMTRKDPPLEEALRCYLNALNCNSQLAGKVGPKLQGVFDAIKKQKEREQKSKQVAEERFVAIQKQAKEIQAKTLASQANSYMTEGRYYEAMELADQANELQPGGEVQAIMMRAYEALQKPGAARLAKSFTAPLKHISELFYNQVAGVLIATDQEAATSVLYDISGEGVRETPLPGIIINVVFSSDNRRFVVVNHKNSMTLWAKNGKKIADLPVVFFNEKCKVEFSPCSQYLLYENGFSAKLWSSDGLNLIDGADTLRPSFTEEFYGHGPLGSFGARFCSVGYKTYLQTFGGESDSVLWDIRLLLQGFGRNSIVKKNINVPFSSPGTDTLLGVISTLPSYFSLTVAANSPIKYLSMAEKPGGTKELGIIKRDHSVVAYAFDKQAGMLATATENGEIALWQFNWSLGFEKQFKNKCVARFDPQSRRVMVLENPFNFHLLDLQGNKLFQQQVYHYDYMPVLNDKIINVEGELLLTSFGMGCSVHNIDGKLLYAHQFSRSHTAPIFSNDGKNVLFADGNSYYNIQVEGFKTNCIFRSDSTIQKAIHSPTSKTVWLWLADGTTVIINEDGTKIPPILQKVNNGYFSPAGNFFVAEMSDTTVALYTALGKHVPLPNDAKEIYFSMDDRFLFIDFKSGKSELRSREGIVLKRMPHKVDYVFSPGSKYALLYDESEGFFQVMNLEKGTVSNITAKGKLISCAFSPNEHYVACAFDNNTIEVLKTSGDSVSTILELGSVHFSPTGNYILIQKNYDTSLYSIEGIKIDTQKGVGYSVPNFDFSIDDKWMVISDFSGKLKVMPSPLGIHDYLNSTVSKPVKSKINNRH